MEAQQLFLATVSTGPLQVSSNLTYCRKPLLQRPHHLCSTPPASLRGNPILSAEVLQYDSQQMAVR
jgi:hypothetical protein